MAIGGGAVTVEDRSLAGRDTWSEAVSNFNGVAHHVRASLSGSRHELILVHTEPEKSILLSTKPLISDRETSEMAIALGQRVVHARSLYGADVAAPPVAMPRPVVLQAAA